ncbi:MAG: hypothetical protein Q8S22_11375, partial [Eubacteriales bacterium]|nr:hypothetical protein [Eubacteriales bacterium]
FSKGIEAALEKQSSGLFLAAGERKPAAAPREAQAAIGLSGEPRLPLQTILGGLLAAIIYRTISSLRENATEKEPFSPP